MKIENVKGKSPYSKKQKQPFAYSDHYKRWDAAIARTGLFSVETQDADAAFRRAFNVPVFKRSTDFGGF